MVIQTIFFHQDGYELIDTLIKDGVPPDQKNEEKIPHGYCENCSNEHPYQQEIIDLLCDAISKQAGTEKKN